MREKIKCHFCGGDLIKRQIEGRERLYCEICNTTIYENPIPATTSVLINDDEVLLVKRAVEPEKGKWCLPGGFMELNEEPEEACLRELKEETNLTGEFPKLQGVYLSNNPYYTSVALIGYYISEFSGELKAGDDCSEAKFFALDNIPKLAFESHTRLLRDTLKNLSVYKTRKINDFGAYVITSEDHIKIADEACKGGAKIIQLRVKDMNKIELLRIAREIRKITKKTNTLLIINDYSDIAIAVGADGVHLGQDDLPIEDARNIAPENFIIGKSTHSIEQAIKAEKDGADYIGIGPVFKTPTKEDYIPIGLDTAEKVIKKIKIPVVAIGGINLENFGQLTSLGFKNIAMVRQFKKNTKETVINLNKRIFGG